MVLNAVEVIGQKVTNNTFARPIVIRCDDNQDYVAKFFYGNDKSILNEFVVGKLAKKLDLSVADPVEINISEQKLIDKLSQILGNPISAGIHIGTPDLKLSFELSTPHHVNLDSKLIENLDTIPNILAFDIFVHNRDRKAANSLVEVTDNGKKPFRYVMIDHGHCMGGPNWESGRNTNLQWNQPGIPWKTDAVTGEDSFLPFIDKLRNLDESDFKNIIQSAPNDWKTTGDDDELLGMLVNRDEDVIMKQIKKYNKEEFPNWNRS